MQAKVRKAPIRAIQRNATAIKKLKLAQLGPLQTQVSQLEYPVGIHITAKSPWLFHLNNPDSGTHGPYVHHINNVGVASHFANFKKDTRSDLYDEADHAFNQGVYLSGVKLDFEFSGFVDNTHIRIDVIRQKRLPQFYLQSAGDQFLPKTLGKLTDMAGFTTATLDRRYFQVLKTKKVFMNSRAVANLEDGAQDRSTVDATTRSIKHTGFYIPIKRKLKSIDTTSIEDNPMGNAGYENDSPFAWSKMHPLANIWVLISTDDQTDLAAIVTGDAVSCSIIRKVYWRDPLG